MVKINFATREVGCKIVYYGPGMSGKTTNLEVIHQEAPRSSTGRMTSIATEGDRTLYFDFMPLEVGTIRGMRTTFQIYTVPGQVHYNATRKIVLMGADGLIFVGDSQTRKLSENRESLENLEANLAEQGRKITDFPVVIQWNKRDLADIVPVEELDRTLNPWGFPSVPAVATQGEGVIETFLKLSQLVIAAFNRDYGTRRL
jgi:signal recognition particle receptor subunit beta